jgi:CheY-like chemotaxis protein
MPKILTVDDSKSVRMMVRRCLEAPGMNIMEAENGAEGLKLLLQGSFDLLILDLMMPVMDGLVTLRMKDAKGDKTPVILLTAEPGNELAMAMQNPCVMDYLTKPLQCPALRAAAAQVFSLKE